MKKIVKLTVAFLLLAGVSALEAADWTFTLAAATKAGAVELQAGDYKVALRGSIAVITDKKSEKSYTVMVKTAESEQNYEHTLVSTAKRDGELKLMWMGIGGTKTKLSFE